MTEELSEVIALFESVVENMETLAQHDGCLYEKEVVEHSSQLSSVHNKLVGLQEQAKGC